MGQKRLDYATRSWTFFPCVPSDRFSWSWILLQDIFSNTIPLLHHWHGLPIDVAIGYKTLHKKLSLALQVIEWSPPRCLNYRVTVCFQTKTGNVPLHQTLIKTFLWCVCFPAVLTSLLVFSRWRLNTSVSHSGSTILPNDVNASAKMDKVVFV